MVTKGDREKKLSSFSLPIFKGREVEQWILTISITEKWKDLIS